MSRLRAFSFIAAIACVFVRPSWANGDGFFRSEEIQGNPQFVIFGNVKDDDDKYLKNALVRIVVPEHMLDFTVETDILGRYRTPDIGLAIKDLGYKVDPYMIKVTVECPDYRLVRREYRGKYQQDNGAIEVNFIMKKEAK